MKHSFILAVILTLIAPTAFGQASVSPNIVNGANANGANTFCPVGPNCAEPVNDVPSALAVVGITPIVSAAAEASHVLKASPGNLYSVYAANVTATAGYLVVLNLTSAPSDGVIAPLDCVPLPASGYASINYNPGPPSVFSVGIVAVVTSGANCFTKTTNTITAFIKGSVK